MSLPCVKWHSFYSFKRLETDFFLGQDSKFVWFFSVPGPFVLRDFLVLFQMLTPGSDMDFCSAFHVNWGGGGVGA